MSTTFLTTSPRQTQKLGEKTAKDILKVKNRRGARVLGLTGGLGGGKTTFLQGFARGLGIKEKVLSPTFIIMRRLKIKDLTRLSAGQGFKNFYHLDCYRIANSKELLDLDFKKIIADPKNIVAVEWADRVKKIMPGEALWINFEFIDNKRRRIVIGTLKKNAKEVHK
ncbi:MAG: tRNA (adenosine(37)-N6)-threonylcarbamoyltransferase complex ATPase subunit type 1 TsaE [bacterium]|nr:tRNA (adenosine(37)-N6)-threonylcarbamoyltransferase complex ATPase subunit type 1 TsaE [bacterium]